MFGWFRKKCTPKLIKDPEDFTKTRSSTEWITSDQHCRSCRSCVISNDYFASICGKCGEHGRVTLFGKSWRDIWNGSEWVRQYKFEGIDGYTLSSSEECIQVSGSKRRSLCDKSDASDDWSGYHE